MKIDLTGKTALVTGAGSGIGAACARFLAEVGALVWVNDLDADRASLVASQIGGRALPGNVAEPGPWLNPLIAHGELHGLVHNAGYDMLSPVGSTDRADFDQLLRVQLTGPFEITQRLLPALQAANGAVVIHIASVHARATNPDTSAYAAAKGGQVAMINSMAQDLGKFGIRVLAVSPGFVDTGLIDAWAQSTPDPAATREFANGLHPLGRIGTPEDIAAFVTFLASPYAEFINATNLVIDGGLTTRLF